MTSSSSTFVVALSPKGARTRCYFFGFIGFNNRIRIAAFWMLCLFFCISIQACGKDDANPSVTQKDIVKKGNPIHKTKKDTNNTSTSDLTKEESKAEPKEEPLTPTDLLSRMLKQPLMLRYSTPGIARYSMLFDAPVQHIQWSAQAGFTVSSGNYLHNVTTKGQERWKVNAGAGHEVFLTEDQEVVWAKQYGTLFQMLRQGRVGWKRNWDHDLAFKPPNTLYLLDASNVSMLGGDGKERWRVTVDGVRKMEGPYLCGELVLFQGKRGQKSMATVVSDKGTVVSETELAFGSVVLGASFQCEPIVWSAGQVSLIDTRGQVRWSYSLKNRPLLYKLYTTYMLIVPDSVEPVSVVNLSKNGDLLFKRALPITGRVTNGRVVEQSGLRQTVALCKDVSSPCARRDGNRGPFNVLLTGERGNFSVLERLVKGHNNVSAFFNLGFVVASSNRGDATTLTMRDNLGKVLWDVVLPGRLSAGPFVGPYGGIYLGTCMGWKCEKPFRFISVTGALKDNDEQEESQ